MLPFKIADLDADVFKWRRSSYYGAPATQISVRGAIIQYKSVAGVSGNRMYVIAPAYDNGDYCIASVEMTSNINFYTDVKANEILGTHYVEGDGRGLFRPVNFSRTRVLCYDGTSGYGEGYLGSPYRSENYNTYAPNVVSALGTATADIYPIYIYYEGDYDVILNDIIPVRYDFKSIAYTKTPTSLFNFSMIRDDKTNEGNTVTDAQFTDFVRLLPDTDIVKIVHSMQEGERRLIGKTVNPLGGFNEMKVLRGARTQYSILAYIEFYFKGARNDTLTLTAPVRFDDQPIADGDTESQYIAYMVDRGVGAGRPSIIEKYYHADAPYTYAYNIRDLSANYPLYFSWLGSDGSAIDTPTDDPYDSTTPSEPSDKGEGFNIVDDDVPIPETPYRSTITSGFISVFSPSFTQLQNFADYLWTGFDITHLQKLLADPMDALISLHSIPCAVSTTGTREIKVGNVATGLSANAVDNQFISIDCGSIKVDPIRNSYLDYAPYTKFTLILPYISSVDISPDDIMNKTVRVLYKIDVLTGDCIAYVTANEKVLYTFNGNCKTDIPVTSASYSRTIKSGLGTGLQVVGTVAGIMSGVGAPVVAGMVSSSAGSLVNTVASAKPDIRRTGSLDGVAGYLGIQKPYLIRTFYEMCVADNQESFTGIPSHISYTLSELTGFTVVESIHLDNVPATSGEKDEIERLLREGVIL